MDPLRVRDVREWTEAVGDDADYLDYLSQQVGLGEWAAFTRAFMPRFVEVEGCILWDRAYEPDNFRTWYDQLRGDTTSIEATLNQFRLALYINIPEDRDSEAAASALAGEIAVSWRRCLRDAFPDRSFEVAASETEDGPVVSFVTVR
ncbi:MULTISPECIES: hypothetical protein [Streptomyces]|uniref:Uncharacterized protein n=1 Tax=Streptomyces murinus TaxID=33900 RepID=A0A7W3NR09_STRMR|nr:MULTISPECIES: hypothetical protein [Streptomyces]MBA9055149.1 hypothetical protein [Streptomyces murinus]TXJ77962.1 hypothetical protein E2C11_16695 [Streptomyces lavendulae]UWW89763.1 hypothetical protein GO605_02065 [Streptomyces murinus]